MRVDAMINVSIYATTVFRLFHLKINQKEHILFIYLFMIFVNHPFQSPSDLHVRKFNKNKF